MLPISVRIAAAGFTNWIPIDRYPSSFSVALGVIFSSNANLTVTVDYTFDLLVPLQCNLTRTTTTATLAYANHGLTTTSSVIVSGAGSPFDGTFTVASVPGQTTITYTVTDSGASAAVDAKFIPLRVFNHPMLTNLTANADSNFSAPPTAVRLRCSSYTAGYADLNIISGGQ